MMSGSKGGRWRLAVLLSATVLAAGCMVKSSHQASSVVQYLYPKKSEHQEIPSIPNLSIPLRVGIAFVPEGKGAFGMHLGEKDKADLQEKISAEFKKYPFIHSIEAIPSPYLTPEGSFDNLDQIRTMYGIDVIALLSYDQVQHTDEGLLSLSYWTLVGAYMVKGEKNDTSTMLDAAVYDIPSRRMLFRAPGLSHVKGAATPVNLSEQLRNDALQGFHLASDDLVVNLQQQLTRFQEKIKERPEEYRVTHQTGYSGGGSLGWLGAGLALAMGGALWWPGRRG
jgi:rhombotail lipoprotein